MAGKLPAFPGPLPDFLSQDRYGLLYLTGHRVTARDIILLYREGHSAQRLAEEFPTLPILLIERFVAFFLENRGELDRYVAAHEAQMKRLRDAASAGPTLRELRGRVRRARAG